MDRSYLEFGGKERRHLTDLQAAQPLAFPED